METSFHAKPEEELHNILCFVPLHYRMFQYYNYAS